jgi:hypothetical protein
LFNCWAAWRGSRRVSKAAGLTRDSIVTNDVPCNARQSHAPSAAYDCPMHLSTARRRITRLLSPPFAQPAAPSSTATLRKVRPSHSAATQRHNSTQLSDAWNSMLLLNSALADTASLRGLADGRQRDVAPCASLVADPCADPLKYRRWTCLSADGWGENHVSARQPSQSSGTFRTPTSLRCEYRNDTSARPSPSYRGCCAL